MSHCEFIENCLFFLENLAEKPVQIEELKTKYCENNNLNCARYMIAQAVGKEVMPPDLYPNEKTVAYKVIAENS
ncbi:MAG: hypothetical protein RQ801_00825 [Spirochaetaceae bacterium]|nr:hypothetical protein [Spirochaetaceae bacterium]MDT8296813.1 hypothetical protein [Spirochaetaceae bacterium]